MGKMLVPAELLLPLSQMDIPVLNQKITELVTLKLRMQQGDPTLTVEERGRLSTVAPYNLDAWDGYFAEREILYQTLKTLDKKVIVLAGDTHNAWASYLHTQQQDYVGVELATSSVSSPGIEKYLDLPQSQLQQFEFAFTTLIDELAYCNLNQRGFLLVKFDAQQVEANWIFVNTVKEKLYQLETTRQHQLVLNVDLQLVSDAQKIA